MGIIKKQAIQSTVLTYIGVLIGFLNSAILMPRYFESEQVGMLNFLNSLTSIIATLATFGIPLISMKMFPHFRSDEKGHNGFFGFIALASLIGIGSGVLFFFLLENQLISEKNAARSYSYFALFFYILFASKVIFRNIDSYVRMLYKTVIGTFLEGVVARLLVFFTLISWVLLQFKFDVLFIFYSLALASSGIFIIIYLLKVETNFNIGQFKTQLGDRKREMYVVGFFGIVGSLGSIIVLEIDRLMVSNMMGLSANGLYSVAFFIGLFISIPARGLRRIASVIISDAWISNDLDTIDSIYKKSSSSLFVISGYLFLCVWFCVPYLFGFMKDEYADGLYVVFFIGLAQIVDMMTGVNAEIIVTSKYYKYNTYFIGGLIIAVIVLNYLFIPVWGINGAAAASLIAMFIINVLRYIFIYAKFGFQPFTFKIVLNLVLLGALYAAFSFAPTFESDFLGIAIIGSSITLIYWIIAYFMKLSDDVNLAIDKVIKRFITRK